MSQLSVGISAGINVRHYWNSGPGPRPRVITTYLSSASYKDVVTIVDPGCGRYPYIYICHVCTQTLITLCRLVLSEKIVPNKVKLFK